MSNDNFPDRSDWIKAQRQKVKFAEIDQIYDWKIRLHKSMLLDEDRKREETAQCIDFLLDQLIYTRLQSKINKSSIEFIEIIKTHILNFVKELKTGADSLSRPHLIAIEKGLKTIHI